MRRNRDDVCGWIEEERDDAQSECSGEENWRERVVTLPGAGVLPPLGQEAWGAEL